MNDKKTNKVHPMAVDLEKLPDSASGDTLRSIHPMGMRVVVRIPPSNETTDGGLYLPESAKKEITTESILVDVMEVASAIDDDTEEETNISGIPKGAKILIPKGAGLKVPWDEALRIVDSQDVLAIVEELSVT